MKILIKQEFRDITDQSHVFHPGEVVDFEDDRAMNIIRYELGVKAPAKEVETPISEPETPKVEEPKAVKPKAKKKVKND